MIVAEWRKNLIVVICSHFMMDNLHRKIMFTWKNFHENRMCWSFGAEHPFKNDRLYFEKADCTNRCATFAGFMLSKCALIMS